MPTGGSRADGTIEVSYEFGMFDAPVPDWEAAGLAASQRCAAWGYSGAEPFAGQKIVCQQPDGFGGCTRNLVTVTYQCVGATKP